MIRHLVALRYSQQLSELDRQALMAELAGLRSRLGGILDFRVFRNVSAEDAVVHGFRDGFWFDFNDTAARDAYLIDTDHQAIGRRLVNACEGGTAGLLVIDLEM